MHDNGMFVVAALIYSTIGLMIFVPAIIVLWLVQHFFVRGLIRWLLLLIPHLIVKGASWSLAWVAVRFFMTPDGLSLVWLLAWMMTKDADLEGDSYWRVECASKGLDYRSIEAKVAWLRKNGGHAFNYEVIGVDVTQDWVDRYRDPTTHWISGGPLWVSDNAFELWISILGVDFMAGWNLIGHQNGRAKYWAQIRRSKPLNP